MPNIAITLLKNDYIYICGGRCCSGVMPLENGEISKIDGFCII